AADADQRAPRGADRERGPVERLEVATPERQLAEEVVADVPDAAEERATRGQRRGAREDPDTEVDVGRAIDGAEREPQAEARQRPDPRAAGQQVPVFARVPSLEQVAAREADTSA